MQFVIGLKQLCVRTNTVCFLHITTTTTTTTTTTIIIIIINKNNKINATITRNEKCNINVPYYFVSGTGGNDPLRVLKTSVRFFLILFTNTGASFFRYEKSSNVMYIRCTNGGP